MLPMKSCILLFLMQTDLKDLPPVLKPASIYGMDSGNGKKNSGCHILKVGNYFFECFNPHTGDLATVHQAKQARRL